jgi:hypothetical protein
LYVHLLITGQIFYSFYQGRNIFLFFTPPPTAVFQLANVVLSAGAVARKREMGKEQKKNKKK